MVSRQSKISPSDFGFRWWFVFSDSDHPILKRVLKPGFSHCWAFCQLENVCLVIEPMFGCVNHIIMQIEAGDLIKAAKDEGNTVVCLINEVNPEKFLMRSPIVTCASYLSFTVGIKGSNITPFSLYKNLLTCGGEAV